MANWSEYEDGILKAGYKTGKTVSEIAASLGRTPGAGRERSLLGARKGLLK